jgi:hypothetical protein
MKPEQEQEKKKYKPFTSQSYRRSKLKPTAARSFTHTRRY